MSLQFRLLTVAGLLGLGACTAEQDTQAGDTLPAEKATQALRSCNASELKLTRFPLNGSNAREWLINNYFDLDTGSGLRDYTGNVGSFARTYNGHDAMDIDISSFREMDNNSATIYAAAPGTVVSIIQDNPDRNTTCTGNWNAVVVEHANGFRITYGHIKRYSARVYIGQVVSAGTPLAVVGSSGCSTQPHIHFVVQDCSGKSIETMNYSGMWTSPPAYAPASDVMDVMLRAGTGPTMDQIKSPAPDVQAIAPNTSLGIGLSLAVRGTDSVRVELVDPRGAVANSATWNLNLNAGLGHYYGTFTLGVNAQTGKWLVRVLINNVLKTTRSFGVSTVAPGGSGFVARHGIASSQYQAVFDDITAAGYRPTWVDGYEVNGSTFFNAVFVPGTVAWIARHNLDSATYQAEFDKQAAAGYRLTQVDSYLLNGQARYAAIWDRSPGTAWVAYHGVPEATHQIEFNKHRLAGYRPVNISGLSVGGTRYITALYDKVNVGSWYTWTGISAVDYQTQFDANVAAGRRLAYVNVFNENGSPRFSAIWNQADSGTWAARHGRTSAEYQQDFNTLTSQGLQPRAVTGYTEAGVGRFAALFTSR